jgi:hypothetical protein
MVNVRKIYLQYLVEWLSPSWKPRYGDWKGLRYTYLWFILVELGQRVHPFIFALAFGVQDTDEGWESPLV